MDEPLFFSPQITLNDGRVLQRPYKLIYYDQYDGRACIDLTAMPPLGMSDPELASGLVGETVAAWYGSVKLSGFIRSLAVGFGDDWSFVEYIYVALSGPVLEGEMT